jgi:hypothetical protein
MDPITMRVAIAFAKTEQASIHNGPLTGRDVAVVALAELGAAVERYAASVRQLHSKGLDPRELMDAHRALLSVVLTEKELEGVR